jgi:hypothetical protein
MKDKLTHTLPQIKCTEKTRKNYDKMSEETKRTISNILQIQTEQISIDYEESGIIFDKRIKIK